MRKMGALIFCSSLAIAGGFADAAQHVNTVSGATNAVPKGYVPPLVSNGSLCMLVDYLGGQAQRSYVNMTPTIFWEGRRYGPPKDQLIPFGHFETDVFADGKKLALPARWSQTLDTKAALVTCRNEYGNGLVVETSVFTPLSHDAVVIKKRVSSGNVAVRSAHLTFNYRFTDKGNENRSPRRVTDTCAWNEASQSAEFRFQADAYRACDGIVSVVSDKAVAGQEQATIIADVIKEIIEDANSGSDTVKSLSI